MALNLKTPGNNNQDGVTESPPPDPVDDLTKIMHSWKVKMRPWPYGLPASPADAARAWITMQEPMHRRERPNRKTITDKDRSGKFVERHMWDTPYNLRLIGSLRAYLAEDRSSQRFIQAAIEDGIPYRGEDNSHTYRQFDGRTLFQDIVHETEIMRGIGPDEYRRRIISKSKATVQRMCA